MAPISAYFADGDARRLAGWTVIYTHGARSGVSRWRIDAAGGVGLSMAAWLSMSKGFKSRHLSGQKRLLIADFLQLLLHAQLLLRFLVLAPDLVGAARNLDP